VNKYLHSLASVGFLFKLNYDARNHELKICCLRYLHEVKAAVLVLSAARFDCYFMEKIVNGCRTVELHTIVGTISLRFVPVEYRLTGF